jgi:uncharacterized protein YuzE
MRATYDPGSDAAYIYLKDRIAYGEVKNSVECENDDDAAGIVLDFEANGVLLGIEVLRPRKTLPKELLDHAERIA